jgi:neutral amino acid transport system ATP-binding protein
MTVEKNEEVEREALEAHAGASAGVRAVADVDVANPAAHVLDDVESVPGVAKPDPILVVDGVVRRFGGLTAVDVDHLEVQRGVITGLIGPNGAGKTTFFNLLTGFDRADGGRWTVDGTDVSGRSPHRLAGQGVVRTFQLTKALAKLSVLDNMMLGALDQTGERLGNSVLPFRWRKQEREVEERARALLERFNMTHMAGEYAGTLSGGQRKLLEMARALMTEPRLMMLDEPMAGVNPALTQSLLGHVKQLRADGMSVIFVEHDMDVVRDISDWVVVMAEGSIVAEGPHSTIVRNPDVIDAYLGRHHGAELEGRSAGRPWEPDTSPPDDSEWSADRG